MPEFKLIEKLLYKSEQNDIEAEFLILFANFSFFA